MKKIVIALICILVIAAGSTYFYLNNRVVFNDENAHGNTSGNLLNGGYFSEDDEKIYFSNPNDNDTLYVMDRDLTHFKKLYDDNASQINAAGNYLIYSRKNYKKAKSTQSVFVFSNVGIYRLKKNGKDLQRLYDNSVGTVNLFGNQVYYQHYSEDKKPLGLTLFQVKINGKEEKMLEESPIDPIAIENKILYYVGTDKDHNIYAYDLENQTSSLLAEGNYGMCIIQDDFLYAMDLAQDSFLIRMNLDGSGKTVLVKEKASTYNVSLSGNYIYYQVDEGDNPGLYRYNIQEKKSQLLQAGYYNSIHVTSDYVFFREFDSKTTYFVSSGSDTSLAIFDPPVKKK